jgi:predicted metal-binding membrane protein
MVAARIRSMARPHWLALYGGILVAWTALYVMALPADLREAGAIYGAEFLRSLCIVSPDAAGYAGLVAMWLLMSAAMMAPTVLPALATYDELGARAQTRFGALIGGYLLVWGGFSVLAAGVQMALTQAGALTIFGDSRSAALSGGLLILAGLYQFSALKEACLSKCRAPLTFFMQHWGEGAFRNGVRLGVVCLGCCWALMGSPSWAA